MKTPARLALALALLLVCVSFSACASFSAFRAAERAERREDYDSAVREYARALKLAPTNAKYRQGLRRARLRAAEEHLLAAHRLLSRGLLKEAHDEARLGFDLDPDSVSLRDLVREIETRQRTSAATFSLDALKERTRERPLAGLALSPAARQPLGLSFSNASLREIYEALGRVAGVNFVFDPQYIDQRITIDLRDIPLEQALGALGTVGRTFYRVTDERVVTIVPDTKNKRTDYEQQAIKSFYLSNTDPKETADLLRVLLGAKRVAQLPGANVVTINDTPERVAAAERIITALDKRRGEVVVEVEILEVNRSRLKDYGIEITSGVTGTSGVAGGAFPKPTIEEDERDASGEIVRDYQGRAVRRERPLILKDNPYKAANLLVSNLPGVIYRLLRQDSSTRLLANPQLRISDGQSAKARFGDEVPVPVTTFVPMAQGGVSSQPFTSYTYKTVGVNIDIKPRVHHDSDVSLELKLEISSVAGTGYQGLPTFNTRTVESIIRLHEGETNVLAGLIRDSERRSLSGLPGLADVPLLGALFARNTTEAAQTDIVMTLTPHIVGRPDITEEDLRSFLVGVDAGASGGEPPPLSPSPTLPTPPRGEPPRIEPIRPPATAPTPPPR